MNSDLPHVTVQHCCDINGRALAINLGNADAPLSIKAPFAAETAA